ncbi:MAG: O-antigen ligase family protein [Acidisphaera sp.]|nr:O-antigen ligase family protein [Acidisphaera sp.]
MNAQSNRDAGATNLLGRIALLGTLSLPVGLLYSRVASEVSIGVVDCCFLADCLLHRYWNWLSRPWNLAAFPWLAWLVLCSAASGEWPVLAQALATLRFLLLAAALADWVLVAAAPRRWLGWMVTLAAGWIALQSWQQYLTGRNLFGVPRNGDGALTGPFNRPRAGPAFLLVFFPALLPAAMALIGRRGWAARAMGALLVVLAVATMVLIGQRMPAVLMAFGLLVCAALLRPLRMAVLGAVVAACLLLAATPVVSPPTFQKLVVHFTAQMEHFASSDYGVIYQRAAVITAAHPLLGLGFNGFRRHCAEPRYFLSLPWIGAPDGGLRGCNTHPHNFYLEAATSSGVPGLLLFAGMMVTWLVLLGRSLNGNAVRVGLLLTALLEAWPLASTSEFFSVPNVGWVFLMLGWGFAELRADAGDPRASSVIPDIPQVVTVS